ncbi:translocation/assembly module TamB domain-containing protein [Myxococcus sp. K15C18031901]|uniref:translocation/assembly module TamB domain-containing protein n=1 Tax=Myxococcus dinghuensis TaxID=2906761 RepID=UPI0020A76671|nr:translocation/assembly module TamB domain-containing protein [Myxococcus dinghuensis]MCP3102267.1 translocation/assembly module TamB domain-containing protein [Myxococcus dinghuensis]
MSARRWGRRLRWGALGLVALVVLVVLGALTWLTSSPGEAFLVSKGLELANEQFSGRLEVGALDLTPPGAVLTGVKLYDPEGELVAEIARVEARVRLGGLLSQRVDLTEVRVDAPRLYLAQDERGLNLSRALAPRVPKPEEPPSPRGKLRVEARDVVLTQGYVDFRQELEDGGERRARLSALEARASGHFAAATQGVGAKLEATAALELPTKGPVRLRVEGGGEEGDLRATLDLEAAGLVLDASGAVKLPPEPPPGQPPTAALTAELDLRRLSVPPELVRGFAPEYPLRVPVSLEGKAGLAGDVARVTAQARAADARLDVDGDLDLEHLRTRGVTVKARDVDLSALLDEGPKTNLSADLKARGGGTRLETLDGEVDLTVSPSRLLGQPLGPVELHARAKDGQYTLERLLVLVPGASLQARGVGNLDALRVDASLSAGNLALLSNALTKLLPGAVPPLAGSGTLELRAEGPPRAPAVSAEGMFTSLVYGDIAVRNLTLDAKVPDVTRPFTTDATLLVGSLHAGGRDFRDLSATIATDDRNLEATVRAMHDAPLGLMLGGVVDEDGQGLAVRTLTLSWPEATWKLQRPTHVGFGGGRVAVEPALVLSAGSQSLSVVGALAGEQLTARVELDGVDLGLLPRVAVPESLGLGGTVTGFAAATGRLPRPDAQARLQWRDGRAKGYEQLQVLVDARYVKDRASGRLEASLPVARLGADFDVPVQGLLRRRRDPMSLNVKLEDVDVAGTVKLVGREDPVGGSVSAQLEVSGPAREPKVSFVMRGRQLTYTAPPPGFSLKDPLDLELRAASDREDDTLDARLDIQGLGSQTYVSLRTPFTPSGLLANPPTLETLLTTVLDLEARVADLPLASFEGVGGLEQAGGTVSAQLNFTGSALVPQARLNVTGQALTAYGLPPVDTQLGVVGTDKNVKVTLASQRDDGPLAQLDATLDAPLGALQDREVYGHIPFQLKGRLGPVDLQHLPGVAKARVQGVGTPRGKAARGIQGVLSVEMGARGTLDTPRVELTAGVQKLGMGDLALGQARLHYGYAEARSAFDLLLTSPSGGTLLVDGGLRMDVSLPAIQRGLETAKAPVEVKLEARDFDPTFLSGSVEMLRSIGGMIRADAKLDGTLGAPGFQGRLTWRDGRLGLMGLGEYREIQLDLEASREKLAVKTLSAKAGAGTLTLEAPLTATRNGAGEFELTSDKARPYPLVARNFPIIYDDQLMALLSMRAKVEGTLTNQLVNLRNVSIPEATIELPEVKRKDLQALERPDDIVLVRKGVPIERRRRRQQQLPSPGEPTPQAQPPSAEATPPPAVVATGGSGEEDTDEGEGNARPRSYWINVNAPRNLWVKGSDLNVELGLSEDFRVEYTDTARLFGQVRVLRGRVDVLGRRFDVQRDSMVSFTGPAAVPYINVTAEHRNESANVTVFVTIRGQGRDITLKPTSEPPLPESEIYTLLATGRRTLERGSGASMTASAQAASVVGSLVANEARKALAAKLPLDVLSIEAGGAGFAGTKLEVGTYVTDKIYVGYTGRVGANIQQGENSNAVRFEYQFSPRWSLEGQYGDARSGGLDLIWSNEY